MSLLKKKRRVLASSLLATIMASTTMLAITPTATAGVNTFTCDNSVVTLTLADSQTGALLPNAYYTVKTSPNTFLLAGAHPELQEVFKKAYNDSFPIYLDSEKGGFYKTAFASTLGYDKPPYPQDITALTDNEARNRAFRDFKEDREGTLAALRADAQRRYDALNNVVINSGGAAYYDSKLDQHTVNQRTKLGYLLQGVNNVKNAYSWEYFVENYRMIVSLDNWSYGIILFPSLYFSDRLAANDIGNPRADVILKQWWLEGNQEAAEAIQAKDTLTLQTDSEGKLVYTVFGVAEGYKGVVADWDSRNRDVRGQESCSHIKGTIQESVAPENYKLDSTVYNVASLDNQTFSLALTNDPINHPIPEVPIFTDTGVSTTKEFFNE